MAKALQELEPADIVHFRNWLLENKTRDQARRTLSSFHSVLIEMKHQGHIHHDPAAGISIKSGGRYDAEDSEVEIPSDQEMRDIYAQPTSWARRTTSWRNAGRVIAP